ncbi:hypothetical protein QNZ76_003030 [Vibrio parahaemolyticus]|nr:hypothetical protein [Vibrio parahaemolyticus]
METSIPYIEFSNSKTTHHVIRTVNLSEDHVSGFTHCLYDNRNADCNTSSDLTVKIQALSLDRECISEKSTLWLNFNTTAPDYRGMSRAERAQKQHREFYAETRRFFDSLIEKNRVPVISASGHKRTKKPDFYTCGIRYPKIRKNAEQSAGLLIMKNGKPYLYAVSIGKIQYSFFATYDADIQGEAFGRVTVEDYDFMGCEYELDGWDIECEMQQQTINIPMPEQQADIANNSTLSTNNSVTNHSGLCEENKVEQVHPIEALRSNPCSANIAEAFNYAIQNGCALATIKDICGYAQIELPMSARFRLQAFASEMRAQFSDKIAA